MRRFVRSAILNKSRGCRERIRRIRGNSRRALVRLLSFPRAGARTRARTHTYDRVGGYVFVRLSSIASLGSRRVVALLRHPERRDEPIRKRGPAGHVAAPRPRTQRDSLARTLAHVRPLRLARERGHKMATRSNDQWRSTATARRVFLLVEYGCPGRFVSICAIISSATCRCVRSSGN